MCPANGGNMDFDRIIEIIGIVVRLGDIALKLWQRQRTPKQPGK